ncbi:MAG: hypothetical protein AAB879_02300 [Patescibacteria group bacterium]
MARTKLDLMTLAARERELRDQLRALKKQARVIERAERQARTERVAGLAEKFGILHIGDTVLATAFKKLAAENPPSTESSKDADPVANAGKDDARTQPADAETAQAGSASAEGEGRKRWPFGG